jgi:hypothetical protein
MGRNNCIPNIWIKESMFHKANKQFQGWMKYYKKKGDCSDITWCVWELPTFCRKQWQAMRSEPSSKAHNQMSSLPKWRKQ